MDSNDPIYNLLYPSNYKNMENPDYRGIKFFAFIHIFYCQHYRALVRDTYRTNAAQSEICTRVDILKRLSSVVYTSIF